MNTDFDREFANLVGLSASNDGEINRTVVADCYRKTLANTNSSEASEVTEMWINLLTEQLSELAFSSRNSDQIAKTVFRKIARL